MRRGALLAFLLVMTGCQADRLSAWQSVRCAAEAEALAGRTAAPLLELRCGGVRRDTAAERALETVARRLEPGSACRVRLLATGAINAYSLPGGLVYLTQGLYKRISGDESLVAAVIAHELAHIAHKDSLRPPCNSVAEALDRESAADLAATGYLRDAGYSDNALARVLELTRDVQPRGWAAARIERLQVEFPGPDNKSRLLAAR